MSSLPLGPGLEFDRIRAIVAALGLEGAGIGDDCALVPPAEGVLALSTDVSVEGVHFRREWLTFEEIGWRAAAAALSDLAGEGAAPEGVLAALTMPRGATTTEGVQVMSGVGAAARAVGASVRGGDLSAGPAWSVAVTVWGRAVRPVTRGGARAGEGLWVTGTLGGAAAAVAAWNDGREPTPAARAAFARPEPRVAAGAWLAMRGAGGMLDLSDGIASDAGHLAAASGVSLRVALERLPLAPGVTDPVLAAQGGEDYELLLSLPGDFADAAAFTRATGLSLTQVGEVGAGAGVAFTLHGKPQPLTGFQHFR